MKIRSKKIIRYKGPVYDLQISNSPSYNVNGVIVHNSSAGCLVSFVLDIVRVDPLKFNLSFERFLSPSRVGKSMVDIDVDFSSSKRDMVKKYIEQRYGGERVCSIGTYTTLQLKAAIKDISRQKQIPIGTVEYFTAALDIDQHADWEELFKEASKKLTIKNFIKDHGDVIEKIRIILGQPKAASVHACATLILPEGQNIYNTVPIRSEVKNNEMILVSEWEGSFIEQAGYLKEDILGISQLEKFENIIERVRQSSGEEIDIYSLPLDQEEVYNLFQEGYNSDVFHLGSTLLTQYSKEMKPQNIWDLIYSLALCRPGPMENNFHRDFLDVRFGRKKSKPYPGTEEITKDTAGILIMQEQIMRTCVEVGGIPLANVDDVRKALGKKDLKVLGPYKEQFLKGAIEKGYNEDKMIELWEAMLEFSKYSFNASHSTVYAITAYVCQYLKWKYPIQFWTVAFQYADDKDISRYISEIHKTGILQLHSPNINSSAKQFTFNLEKKEIYWSIGHIKRCGDVSLSHILEERERNGEFFSFKEFLQRVPKNKVNKAVVENLLYSGAFDELENIKRPIDRLKLINYLKEFAGKKGDFEKIDNAIKEGIVTCNWWWLLLQKNVSGYAFFDYESIIRENKDWKNLEYISLGELNLGEYNTKFDDYSTHVTAGVIQEIDIRKSKDGVEFARILLENNYDTAFFFVRGFDNFKKHKDYIMLFKKGDIFIGSGIPQYNKWLKQNVIQSVSDFNCEGLSTGI